jgi:purine-cytosine permease-like protein
LFGALWLGAVVATVLPGWSAIALPCATVVMCVDQFLLPRLLGLHRSVDRIPEWRGAGVGNWPAIVAVIVSVLFGAWGLGLFLFPGQTSAPSLGLVPVEAWLLAGVLYLVLAALVARASGAKAMLGFASHLRDGHDATVAPAPAPEVTG